MVLRAYNAIQIFANLSLLGVCVFIPDIMLVHQFVKTVECLQFFDIILSIIGLTRSSVVTTSVQTIAKTCVVIAGRSNYIRYLGAVWALSDAVRYAYYLLPQISIIKTLRYSQYKILYPIGIGLEIATILPVVTNSYLQIGVSLLYTFGSPYMFNHTSILETQQHILSVLKSDNIVDGEYTITYGKSSYSCDETQYKRTRSKFTTGRFNWKLINDKSAVLKDYGIQISWRLVYLIEYFGALVAFPMMAGLGRIDTTLWVVHYTKRLFESVFVHTFSSETMPLMNVFKNSAYYWGAGLLLGYYSQGSDVVMNHNTIAILMCWTMCQMGNGFCHWYLASLRSDKTLREHILPMNVLFRWVVCPNYTFEIMGWALFSLLGNGSFVVRALFCFVGAFQMYTWAGGKKLRYKKLFGDKYKVTGNLLPGI